MPIGEAIEITSVTLVAGAIWHYFYLWIVELGASEYEGLLLTSVIQSIICVLCFFADHDIYGVPTTQVRQNNPLEFAYMVCAAGYFLHDTPHWRPRLTLTSITLFVHHILAFFFLMAVLFYGKGGSIALQISVVMEITTPLLGIRHYFRKYLFQTQTVQLVFAVCFIILRFWWAADIVLWVVQSPDVPLHFKFGVCCIFVLSCGMLPGVFRMVLRDRPSRDSPSQPGGRPRLAVDHFSMTSGDFEEGKTGLWRGYL